MYPEGIDHDVLLVEGGDRAREVVGNETTRFDLQTGESLVEDRDKSIVRSIMSDAYAGCADDIVQHVMDFIVEVAIQLLRVGKVRRPVSLGFFQVIMSVLYVEKAKASADDIVDTYPFAKSARKVW